MLKRGIFILCLLVFAVHVHAQSVSRQVLVPLASVASTETYCVSQTIGEAVVQYIRSDYFDLSQGFQQASAKSNTNEIPNINGNGVKVYPNPVQTELTIELFGDLSREYRLIIFGFNGSIYKENTYNCISHHSRKIRLDVSDFSRGIYFVKIESYDGIISRLFKVEKL